MIDDREQQGSIDHQLLSVIAHDLRNPLAGLLVMLQTIRRECAEPTLDKDVATAIYAAERVSRALDDMIEAQLIEQDRLDLTRTHCSMSRIVESAVDAVAHGARERGVRIDVTIECDAQVNADAPRFQRAIENLIVHAVKHSPRGPNVRVTLTEMDSEIIVRVDDRGPSVGDADKHKLVSKTGAAMYEHAARRPHGLGLYFTRLLVDAHGGRLEIADRDGGGLTFRVRIAKVEESA